MTIPTWERRLLLALGRPLTAPFLEPCFPRPAAEKRSGLDIAEHFRAVIVVREQPCGKPTKILKVFAALRKTVDSAFWGNHQPLSMKLR